MAITRVKASSLTQGLPKRKTALAGNDVILPGSYDAIGTVTVGAGGQATITFSSIPATYKHLQIRGIVKTTATLGGSTNMIFNSNTSVTYACHGVYGNGSSAGAFGFPNETKILTGYGNQDTTYYAPQIIDILDYANTNKYKTARIISGDDNNGGGNIGLFSGVWFSTSAITSISLNCQSANFAQYSQFALYGIK